MVAALDCIFGHSANEDETPEPGEASNFETEYLYALAAARVTWYEGEG